MALHMFSIVKKVVMAVTGLLWFGFLITHVLGNTNLFFGPEKFNAYSKGLQAMLGPFLYAAEIGLVLLLILHVISAIRVTLENRAARPVGYSVKATKKQATVASRTMVFGGLLLLVFLVLHVRFMKFGPHESHALGLWGVATDLFKNPIWVAFYLLSMVALGLHLSHGLASALQTLGTSKPAWRPTLRRAGAVIGWGMTAWFMSMPIWGYLR